MLLRPQRQKAIDVAVTEQALEADRPEFGNEQKHLLTI